MLSWWILGSLWEGYPPSPGHICSPKHLLLPAAFLERAALYPFTFIHVSEVRVLIFLDIDCPTHPFPCPFSRDSPLKSPPQYPRKAVEEDVLCLLVSLELDHFPKKSH